MTTTTNTIDLELTAAKLDNELRDEELEQAVGGDGPPSTAGDGNGRAMQEGFCELVHIGLGASWAKPSAASTFAG